MEPTTVTVLIVLGVIALGVLAFLSRMFFRLLKLVIFAVIIAVVAGFIWTRIEPERNRTNQPTPVTAGQPRPR